MKITWVDINASESNPSMQHLAASADEFITGGYDVRLICENCKPSLENRIDLKLTPQKRSNFNSIIFSLRSNWLFFTRPALIKNSGIVHSTGANVFDADLISMHFIPVDWLKILIKAGDKDWRDWCKVLVYVVAAILEWIQRTRSKDSHFHAVSRSLANSLIEKGIDADKVTVIPTPYNAAKFHVQARLDHRATSRFELGFEERDVVFSFISQGSYHRKGVGHAAETVHLLRLAGHPVHLLIIGGKGPSWERMKTKLEKRYPESSEWLHVTGFVPDLVHTLAASDAFLLPSLYEGFAAVEVEAAAMGIPLLLTQHPGVEMILQEGENGWLIDQDPKIAAGKIVTIIGRIRPMDHANVGEAVTLEEWQKMYFTLYRKLEAAAKWPMNRMVSPPHDA